MERWYDMLQNVHNTWMSFFFMILCFILSLLHLLTCVQECLSTVFLLKFFTVFTLWFNSTMVMTAKIGELIYFLLIWGMKAPNTDDLIEYLLLIIFSMTEIIAWAQLSTWLLRICINDSKFHMLATSILL
jgi:hypothetical protein